MEAGKRNRGQTIAGKCVVYFKQHSAKNCGEGWNEGEYEK